MCKIIVITNASEIKDMEYFSRGMAQILSSQRDGFGFAAVGTDNKVFGAKSLFPLDFAKNRRKADKRYLKFNTEFFGEPSTTYKYAMFHGRISTNKVTIRNTHPMIIDDNYLIHNGVVDNIGEQYEKKTENDSEDILYHYLKGGMDGVAAGVQGYYACATITGPERSLDIFKDNIAPLCCAWSSTLNSQIFASTAEVIDDIATFLNEDLEAIPVRDNIWMRFDGNDVKEMGEFTPTERMSEKTRKAAKQSIGKSLPVIVNGNGKTQKDVTEFLTEDYMLHVECLDSTYSITNKEGVEITMEEFKHMNWWQKIVCVLRDSSGKVIKPFKQKEA